MSYIFKPRRGNITTMASSSTVLSTGEMFLEYPSDGVGKGDSNIKIGDGSTAYSSLPYAIGSQAPVTFTATTDTNNSTLLGKIVSGASSATMFAAIKNLLTNLNSSVSELEDEFSSITNGIILTMECGYIYVEMSSTISAYSYSTYAKNYFTEITSLDTGEVYGIYDVSFIHVCSYALSSSLDTTSLSTSNIYDALEMHIHCKEYHYLQTSSGLTYTMTQVNITSSSITTEAVISFYMIW